MKFLNGFNRANSTVSAEVQLPPVPTVSSDMDEITDDALLEAIVGTGGNPNCQIAYGGSSRTNDVRRKAGIKHKSK